MIGNTRGSCCDLDGVCFFPSIASDVLKMVRPVISLDAAHLCSEYIGMLYMASVLSGGDLNYPPLSSLWYLLGTKHGKRGQPRWYYWNKHASMPHHICTRLWWTSDTRKWCGDDKKQIVACYHFGLYTKFKLDSRELYTVRQPFLRVSRTNFVSILHHDERTGPTTATWQQPQRR